MAMSDLVIQPHTKALRYAMGILDEFRMVFQDLEEASFEPQKVRLIAKRGRGRVISVKATLEDAIEEEIAEAIAAPSGDKL